MILFAHEYASDGQTCARYCRPLLDAGYDVFSFDFRGHGASGRQEGYEPRQWATEREVADMVGALAFLGDRLEGQGRPPEVGVVGISRGASAAVIAAVNHTQIRAMVCDGIYSSDTLLEHLMKRWAYIFAKVRFVYENHPPEFWRFLRWMVFMVAQYQLKCKFPSTRKALQRMPARPILFIHGEKDSYVPADYVRDLYAQASEPKELWICPGAKHNQAAVVMPEAYAERTVAFFDRHLAGETPDRVETLVESVVAEAAQPYESLPSPRVVPVSPSRRSEQPSKKS
jgi:pimeloyl-ACP methyl ester carboxylesterase